MFYYVIFGELIMSTRSTVWYLFELFHFYTEPLDPVVYFTLESKRFYYFYKIKVFPRYWLKSERVFMCDWYRVPLPWYKRWFFT